MEFTSPFLGLIPMQDGDRRGLSDARVNDSFVYEHDFGDGWEHLVLVEKILRAEEGVGNLPVCLAGGRACPPEDCGGGPGYESFLQVIGDPAHEEHGAMPAWVGGQFDPEAFDLGKVKRQLRRLKRITASGAEPGPAVETRGARILFAEKAHLKRVSTVGVRTPREQVRVSILYAIPSKPGLSRTP